MKIKIVIFFLFFLCRLIFAQQSDSLFIKWQNEKLTDTIRLQSLEKYYWTNLMYSNPEQLVVLAKEEIQFAKERGLYKYAANALNAMASANALRSNYSLALYLQKKSLEIQSLLKNKKGMASSLSSIGNYLLSQGMYKEANDYFLKALHLNEELNDKRGIAYCYGYLGTINIFQKEYIAAIAYYEKSLQMSRELKDMKGISSCLGNLGSAYNYLNDYDKGRIYYLQALQIQREIGDKFGESVSATTIGNNFYYRNMDDSALFYLDTAFTISAFINDKKMLSKIENVRAMIYYYNNKIDQAEAFAKNSSKLALEVKAAEEIKESYITLHDIFMKKLDYKNAYNYYMKYLSVSDSLVNESEKNEIIQKQVNYEFSKKLLADSIKSAEHFRVEEAQVEEQKVKLERDKNFRIVLLTGILGVILGSVFVIRQFSLAKQQKQLIETQKEEVHLAYNSLSQKNKEILDSIHYAKRIQSALLCSNYSFHKQLARTKTN